MTETYLDKKYKLPMIDFKKLRRFSSEKIKSYYFQILKGTNE